MGVTPHAYTDAATYIPSTNLVYARISDQTLALLKTSFAALASFQDVQLGLQLLHGI